MSSPRQMPPRPEGRSLYQWASELADWLRVSGAIRQQADPTAVLLAHKRDTGAFSDPRATVCGILLYDRAAGNIIHSCEGEFVAVINSNVIKRGTGTPEGAVTAPVGTLFLRSDGGAGTTLYVKESGTGNTGWVGK